MKLYKTIIHLLEVVVHMSSFLRLPELAKLGLASYGSNVLISRFARLYNPNRITIGDNVRIDDFAILSAGKISTDKQSTGQIKICDHVHIAAHTCLWGHHGIFLGKHVGISSGCKIYTESDDFSGETLTGPTIPDQFKTNMTSGRVIIGDHTIVGANSVILPSVIIGEGCAFGSNSVINSSPNPWTIHVGSPIKMIGRRKKGLLKQVEILEME